MYLRACVCVCVLIQSIPLFFFLSSATFISSVAFLSFASTGLPIPESCLWYMQWAKFATSSFSTYAAQLMFAGVVRTAINITFAFMALDISNAGRHVF